MKHPANNFPSSPAKPSAVRGGGGSLAFARERGVMVAKSTLGPSESTTTPAARSLETILLPHARTRWMTPAAAGMTPSAIESILKESMTGKSPRREQELYTLMEGTWPRMLKNVEEVKNAVLGLDWNLMDAADEDRVPGAKELIERTRNGMKGDPCRDGQGWRSTLRSLLDARARGISVAEIQWEYRGGRKFRKAWLPKQTFDIPAWHYGWRTGPVGNSTATEDYDGSLVLYPDSGSQEGIELPPNKFLVAISKAGKGHPSGTALLRCLAWFWCASNFSQEWLLNFAQIFGQPFRWATYDPSQEGVKDALAAMMEKMGSAAYGVGPEGTKVDWHESSKSGSDNPQAHMMNIADEACDLLILGQTLTSTVGDSGSRALGDVHQSVRGDIIDSAADWLAEILNEQFIPAIIAVNYGDLDEDESLPYFQPARKEKKDIKVIAETFKIITDAGFPILKEEVYEALDLSQPEEGDDVFGNIAASSGVSGAILTALAAAGLRVTDVGIRQLTESVGIEIERDPNGGATGAPPTDTPPALRQVLAKLPLDAREYLIARLPKGS